MKTERQGDQRECHRNAVAWRNRENPKENQRFTKKDKEGENFHKRIIISKIMMIL
jgi:hypothetical protein